MRMLAILFCAVGLSGCIAVPVSDGPGVYVGVPVPALVVRPYYGHGGPGGPGGYRGYRGYRQYGGDRHRWN